MLSKPLYCPSVKGVMQMESIIFVITSTVTSTQCVEEERMNGIAGGREYVLKSFMTDCMQMQNRAHGLCSHEVPLYPTVHRNKDGCWQDFTDITAPECSASLWPSVHMNN